MNFNPTHTIDVNSNARIRNTPVAANPQSIIIGQQVSGSANDRELQRLDFTGNANQVLLGDGTWGTAPGAVNANNGTSINPINNNVQLGDQYSIFPFPTFTNNPLLQNRQVRLNGNNFIFSGNGAVAIGLDWPFQPTEVLDVNGNARFRDVQAQGGQSLILGLQQGGNADDVELSRLEFSGNNTDVLLGDGTWGPAATNLNANNGIFNNGGDIQLGAPCNNLTELFATQFTESRTVFIRNNDFWMASFNNESGGVGFGGQPALVPFCGTGNTVEISANNKNVKYGNTDASGLRFTKLTSLSPTIANGVNGVDNTKVLTVDEDGDVVYVNVPTGGGFVECTNTTGAANLNADSKINLDNNQLYFENNDVLGLNHVGIGYDCGNILDAKLSVQQIHPASVNENTTTISGVNSDVTNDVLKTYTGVYGEANGEHPLFLRSTNIGGEFRATGADRNYALKATIEDNPYDFSQNVGLRIDVNDEISAVNYGILGSVRGSINSTSVGISIIGAGSFTNTPGLSNQGIGGQFTGTGGKNRNIGVVGGNTSPFNANAPQIDPNEERFGVAGFAMGAAGGNYAIYGETDPTFADSYAGYFAGPVVMNQASIWSDENLKENIEEMDDTDSLLNLLNPVSFEYTHTGDGERLNLPQGKRMGLLAQQVEQVFPEFVTTARHPAELDSMGNIVSPALYYKVLDMEQFVPFLIKDAQVKSEKVNSLQNELAEKDSVINDINDRLTQLENCLSNLLPTLCQINNTAIQENDEETQEALLHQINVELFDGENIILEQNIPNPFAERTVINYKIPASVGDAKLLFYNNQGRMIREVKITERGAGQINVFGAELSKGTYSYTLICDGEVISTKKMVKQ